MNVKEIVDLFQCSDMTAKRALVIIRQYDGEAFDTMEKLNFLLDCFGVHSVFVGENNDNNEFADKEMLYLNTEESYQQTIIYSSEEGFIISNWGDEVEAADQQENQRVIQEFEDSWDEISINEKVDIIKKTNSEITLQRFEISKDTISIFASRKSCKDFLNHLENIQFSAMVTCWDY